MSSTTVLVILLVVGLDLLIVPLVMYTVFRGSWTPLADRFPHTPAEPDAVRRNFQSYKLGLVNLGFMIHTAVDEQRLHLLPATIGRLFGMKPVSIPWEAIEPVRMRGRKYAEVKVGSIVIIGPAWALGLAFDEPTPEIHDSDVH